MRPLFSNSIVAVLLVLGFAGCEGEVFVAQGEDGGVQDAGSVDAGTGDAGQTDAGQPDAGESDAGIDAGVMDAGSADAGSADAGEVDAGNFDAGEGDAGSPDAGEGDAGVDAGTDAGTPDAGDPCAGVTCTALDSCHAAGVCDSSTGLCSNPNTTDGTACNDGNFCTQTDTCVSGACTGSNPVTCVPFDQCHALGSCNPSNGSCSSPPVADGTACNDGNACTQTDLCVSGVCVGSNPVTCVPFDQCHAVGTCDVAIGVCSNPPAADGTTCSDGNACTQTDTCEGGACTGSNVVTCTSSDSCHLVGTCNPTSGACSNPLAADGTSCSDGQSCTTAGACDAGTCVATSAISCSSMVCGNTLAAFSGTQTSSWKLNGSAAYDSNANTVVLTDATTTPEAGTTFYEDAIATDGFTFTFDFRSDTLNGRADGIAFVMQTNGATQVGEGYGGFGAMTLTGYAVELDIFDSGPCDDGNGNHAGIDFLASCASGIPPNSGIPEPIAASPDLYTEIDGGDVGVGDIGDGAWRTVTIELAAGQLSVSITDPTTGGFIAVPNLQGVTLPGFSSTTSYYLGLAASSGSNGLYAKQEIRNVQVTFGAKQCL